METAPPEPTATDTPRRKRLRFSMKTMVLLITIVCLTLANFLTARNWDQAKRQVAQAQKEFGLLVVEDPSQFNAVCVPSVPRSWSWKVHLPPGRKYRVCRRVHEIPETGFPEPEFRTLEHDSGEIRLTFTITFDHRGVPKFSQAIVWEGGGAISGSVGPTNLYRDDSLAHWADAQQIDLFSNQLCLRGHENEPDRYFAFTTSGVTQNRTGAPVLQSADDALELLRFRVMDIPGPEKLPMSDPFPKVQKDVPEFPELTHGLMVWIEPVEP